MHKLGCTYSFGRWDGPAGDKRDQDGERSEEKRNRMRRNTMEYVYADWLNRTGSVLEVIHL